MSSRFVMSVTLTMWKSTTSLFDVTLSAVLVADVTVTASSNVYTTSKSADPSCAYVPAVKSTDKRFGAPNVDDKLPIATKISGCASALSLPLAPVPAAISQPRVVARTFSLAPGPSAASETSTTNLGLDASEVDFPHKAISFLLVL